ncbi:MAG TPA: FecR domain-containing protein [Anaerohalosphaeraceae bacterium]|nr:FecR domain-containing protein [Anaerohalosphaeraceae bacterium]
MNGAENRDRLWELVVKVLEGQLRPDEMEEMNRILQMDEEAAYLYAEFFDIVSGLVSFDKRAFCSEESDSARYEQWLNCLADEEKTAQAVEIHPIQAAYQTQESVPVKRVHPPVSRVSFISLVLSSAALFFVLAYGFWASLGRGEEVVTLSDAMNAKWADAAASMQRGTRLATGRNRWLLREGYAELLFDNQARVVLEGPAEFQILAEDRLGLHYGKVYVKVPPEAAGFSVYTQNAKIIDLGTEFGVQADIGGITQVHVLKGRTMLMAGRTNRTNLELGRGSAKKISGENGDIADIKCREDYFVRAINSRTNSVWKGQNRISLADIVGNGNGFGTGIVKNGLDVSTGNFSKNSPGRQSASNEYHPVFSNSYIDGVFVPNGRATQIISSQGHIFEECPATSELWCYIISYERLTSDFHGQEASAADRGSFALPSMLIHANSGITFSLDEIRSHLPGVRIARFQSKVGMRPWCPRPEASNADFWVLVDGQLKCTIKQVKTGEVFPVDVELPENASFLTLVQTDGGDPEKRVLNGLVLTPIDSDWGVFIDPVLILE